MANQKTFDWHSRKEKNFGCGIGKPALKNDNYTPWVVVQIFSHHQQFQASNHLSTNY